MNNNTLYLQLIFISCIVIFAKCIAIRAVDELLSTSTQKIQNCRGGEFEALFGAQFQVRDDSNITILIDINENHPSLNGESLVTKIFKDNIELEFLFPNSPVDFPIEAPLASNFEPGSSNILIVYGQGLVPIALKLRSIQVSNRGEYRIDVGTLSTPILATATSNLEFKTNCGSDPNGALINKDTREVAFQEIVNYEKKFGGRVYAPAGSTLALKISFNERHPILEGESPQVTLYKDGVELRSLFGFISEGAFPLESELGRKYPNIYISYDFGFVFNSLIIRDATPAYTGEYTLTISTRLRFGIANATTLAWFGGNIDPPSLKRSSGDIIVYSKTSLNYSEFLGGSFIVLSSTWNSISLIAEDKNNNQVNAWKWYFTPNNQGRRLIEQSSTYNITEDGNSSTLLIQNCSDRLFGQYTVEVSNSAGLDSESTEINRIQIPRVNHGMSIAQDEPDVIRIGQHVDITQLKNQRVVIEARDRTGFPKSKTNWFFSEWKNGIRVPIQNSENLQIVSTSEFTGLVIQNATKAGFGYYFAVASNIAGIDESCTILGQSPSLLITRGSHLVRGFVKGQIGDSFKIKGNSQISIEASTKGFPPASFTWFEKNYHWNFLYNYERKIVPSSTLMIGNTLNKSILTQLVPFEYFVTKYMVTAKNPLGKVNAYSYALRWDF